MPIITYNKWQNFTQEVYKFLKFKNKNNRDLLAQVRKIVEAKKELDQKKTYKNKSQRNGL